MTNLKNHESILLRVARGGPLDRMIRPILEEGKAAETMALAEALGRKDPNAGTYHMKLLDKWFDNVTVQQMKDDTGDTSWMMTYTDVKPKHVTAVSEKIEQVATAKKVAAASVMAETSQPQGSPELGEEPVIWPDVPPQIQGHPNYVEPKWYKPMLAMLAAGRHIRLMGPPSVGKDTAIEQAAIHFGKPLVSLPGSSLRERHMTGARAMDASGRSYFLPTQFAAAVVHGWFANISEVNAADQDVLLWINTITEKPFVITLNGRSYPVHPEFRLFISYNPGALGTRPIPASLADRFFPVSLSFHTESSLRRILEANGMPKDGLVRVDATTQRDWTTCLVNYVMELWATHEAGKMKYQITVRRCMDVVALMNYYGNDNTIDSFKQAVRAAIVDGIDNPLDAKEAERILRTVTC